jgi:hypothetical protein
MLVELEDVIKWLEKNAGRFLLEVEEEPGPDESLEVYYSYNTAELIRVLRRVFSD